MLGAGLASRSFFVFEMCCMVGGLCWKRVSCGLSQRSEEDAPTNNFYVMFTCHTHGMSDGALEL